MSNITITSIKPSYMNKNIPNIKNETILDKIKKQRQKHRMLPCSNRGCYK